MTSNRSTYLKALAALLAVTTLPSLATAGDGQVLGAAPLGDIGGTVPLGTGDIPPPITQAPSSSAPIPADSGTYVGDLGGSVIDGGSSHGGTISNGTVVDGGTISGGEVIDGGVVGGGGMMMGRSYGRPDLFYNFYSQGYANQLNAQMYMSPLPVPPNVGHTFYTYQPFYPHEMLYWHKDRYHRYYDNGRGMNRTRAIYYSPPVRQAISNVYWNYLRLPR